ncbi:hypothetical protein [Aureimonas leprariae]|uniref:Uncharacterized protein n=1 Tax=Plantimonas leprariae TaxID=2615207 RepID=A0A7V7U0K4_9HYPH|nr:hypothetical protein [Aureimonas leprariae]KAB0680634.1 hypothetical protein F6X38_06395 [Aureimonas leprariae]
MSVGTLARLLSALSAECDELAVRVDDMHRFLTRDPSAAPRSSEVDYMVAAQDIDFIQQHLAGLSEFLMVMAEMTPDAIRVDLAAPLATVKLSDMKRRLSGTDDDDAPQVRPGELELL